MSSYLLDTHVLLWWLDDPEKLAAPAREAISSSDNVIFVSAAAAWEMSIKKSLGRLDYPDDLPEALQQAGIRTLPITLRHALSVVDLPPRHQDPFDRMQIAQAISEGLILVTRDAKIEQYDVPCLKA